MRLSANFACAAVAATLVSASPASAAALITETYDGSSDAAYLHVTNTGNSVFSSVSFSGGFAGGSASFNNVNPGDVVNFYLGDNENDYPGSQGTALVTVVSNQNTYSGSYTDTIGDPDYTVGPVTLGTLNTSSAVPEPATWAMLLTGFGLLGGAMRMSRRKKQTGSDQLKGKTRVSPWKGVTA